MNDWAPEYVTARRVLLDALTALAAHLDNLILVGAQAVYHHAGETDLNVPLLTTDGDLAINTQGLAEEPEIGRLLRGAGFTPGPNPGHWVTSGDVAVDLMVVPHQAGTTKPSARAGRLSSHEKLTARIARGLEPALIDNMAVTISALEPEDPRTFELRVAGPAALLTAKAIKISERLEQADTQPDRTPPGWKASPASIGTSRTRWCLPPRPATLTSTSTSRSEVSCNTDQPVDPIAGGAGRSRNSGR